MTATLEHPMTVADFPDTDDQQPDLVDAVARVAAFLDTIPYDLIKPGRAGKPGLHGVDIQVLLTAAGDVAALELEVAELRLAAGRRERTGVLLSECRAERDIHRVTFAEIETLAHQHLRGDPHGPQGAAAQLILEALSRSARALTGA